MKPLFTSGFAALVITLFLGTYTFNDITAQKVIITTITYQHFYDGLSPHGVWIDYPGYGHVWHPSVDGYFRPYLTNGYWDYTIEGWIWISNYEWGWAPFHYGRWLYDDLYGWLWVPGYEWAPAWVIWGYVDDYYAWAPLMPSVNVVIWFGTWRPPARIYWNIVGRRYICNRDIYDRVERHNLDERIVNRIRINNNYGTTPNHDQYYARGPGKQEVEKYTNRTITPVSINEVNKVSRTGRQGNTVRVYKPNINTAQPRSFRSLDEISPRPVRSKSDKQQTESIRQKQNIERLPVRKAPQSSPRKDNRKSRSTRINNN